MPDEAVKVGLLGGPRDGVELVLGTELGFTAAPAQLVLPRLEPPIEPGLSTTLELLARWARGEPCPVRLVVDLYELRCDDETGALAYVYGGCKPWELARWREVPGVNWHQGLDPRWGV
jgi:hypothetical protein